MSRVFNGALFADCHASWPRVILLGTAYQFSDQLLKLLRVDFDGVQFERTMDLEKFLDQGPAPKVVVIHEEIEDLESQIAALRTRLPESLIAIGCGDPQILERMNASCNGLPVSALRMDAQVDVWFSILRLLLSGHPYVPVATERPAPARRAAPALLQDTVTRARPDGDAEQLSRLTPREMEILPLIAQGEQNKMIAGRLGLSIHTVKLHSHNIYAKLGVTNRTGAANWYLSQMMGRSNGAEHSRSG